MFKVITSYKDAQALGQCGLLWWKSDGFGYVPSTTDPVSWSQDNRALMDMVEDGEYAILLEE